VIPEQLSEALELPRQGGDFNREKPFSVSDFNWLAMLMANSLWILMGREPLVDTLSERLWAVIVVVSSCWGSAYENP
jgi:amino acid permease